MSEPKEKHLGRIAQRSDPRAVMFAKYLGATGAPPKRSNFWHTKAPFAPGDWGNISAGDCTIAKQAVMFRRFERIERRRTIDVTTEEALRVYFDMTKRLYGGGDAGAYETDALDQSRSPDTCLHDTQGHPLLIDAYTRVDPKDLDAMRWAIKLSLGHGIAGCIDLPLAFSHIESPQPWDIPLNQPLIGDWEPGSWGGHSIWLIDYDEHGVYWEPTWDEPVQLITWRAWAAYGDEAHTVIDSVDAWRKKAALAKNLDIAGIVKAVNKVSRTKIAA
jgi:hypothetical protein